MKLKILITLTLIFGLSFGQNNIFVQQELSINNHIDGTLLIPNKNDNSILVVIIADSGPTDRNGNQNFLKNNSLKKLSEALYSYGIASYRYDKRIVKQIRRGNLSNKITFDDYVTDANSVIEYFKSKNAFSKIYIIGHSQGSLVGMLAAKNGADGFISIAGAGKSIDKVIMEQIEKTAARFTEDAKKTFDILKQGKTTNDYPKELSSIFDRDIQLFMSSWMQYDPESIIEDLQMPILIINGTKDLQVSVEEATHLKEATSKGSLRIIDDMNHVMFIIEGDDLENSKSYNESFRPISSELIDTIVAFLN